MNDSREQMIAALREIVIPTLRKLGFSGSFPHFRRARENQIDVLSFQFNRYGGSFVVELAYCSPEGIATSWGEQISAKKVCAHHIHPQRRVRLGSNPPEKADHWFYFESSGENIYQETALEVLSIFQSKAELFWQTHQPAMMRTN